MSIFQDTLLSKYLLRTYHVLHILFLKGLTDELSLVEKMNKPVVITQSDSESRHRAMHRENSCERGAQCVVLPNSGSR